ncbi:amine oxidase-like protein [Plenodomus tracheiphilus IPT5]|uniref:Amine oxidase-like protein n=1 Tax=Plenodomus tracheiphilus IPT5 TaxID=1408161 RepID=A0A6A7B7C5_9PLEO|nr:amine oxidase-like protein [Plenodomus tracheiphilus IPT5]
MRTSLLLAAAVCTPIIYAAPPSIDCEPTGPPHPVSPFAAKETIKADVLILGGGATGVDAGLRLRDQNKSIAIVESSNLLGGHVETLIDPVSGKSIEYGVQAYIDNDQTRSFFGRFNVSLDNVVLSPFPSKIVDFNTGVMPPNASAVNPYDFIGPLANYLFTTINFNGISEGAYDLPSPVPADLYMPFGAFVTKYNLTEVLQVVWIFAHGVGNLLETPTLYVLQNFGQPHLLGLSQGYLAPTIDGGIQEVYNKAAAQLGKSVLYKSKVVQTTRSAAGVSVVVQTSHGPKVIEAKKLLVTIPPTIENLSGFDLTPAEIKVFSQWQHVPYYVGVLHNTGLPDLTNFYNVDLKKPANLPEDKFVWRIETVGVSGYLTVKVVGEADSGKAKKLVKDAVARIGKTLGVKTKTEFVAWQEHKNLQLKVDPKAIAGGFYADLYALQGNSSTFWTGNAWASDYSPLLWAFTEKRVLPSLLG